MNIKITWMVLAMFMTLLGSFPETEWQAMNGEEQQEITDRKIDDFSAKNDCKIAAGQVRKIGDSIYIFGFCLVKKKAKIAPGQQPLKGL